MLPVLVVIGISSLGALARGADSQGLPKDFCALRVLVTHTGGELPYDTVVRLLDPSGKEVAREQTWRGEASFCDFGFGEHTLVVGRDDECGRVAVYGIRLRLHTQFSHVVNNLCTPPFSHRYPPSCLVYFRVASRDGVKLRATVQTPAGRVLAETDKYGRAWVGAREGFTEEYLVISEGYEPAKVTVRCENQRDIEQEVLLQPRPRR